MAYKYKHTQEEMVENIHAVYVRTRECVHCQNGEADRWYALKGAWIREQARKYGVSLDLAFNAYALFSANATVSENDRHLLRYLRKQEVKHFPSIKARVRQARAGDPRAMEFANAAKILTYAENLRYPRRDNGATVDRHAARIAVGDPKAASAILARANLAGYRLIEGAYYVVARWYGVRGHEVQAPVWVHVVDGHEEMR